MAYTGFLIIQIRKNNKLYRLTNFRNWYNIIVHNPSGLFNTYSYKNLEQAKFIFSGLTGHKFKNQNSHIQLNLF